MVFIGLIPFFADALGNVGLTAISVIAGTVLLLDTALPIFIGKDSAERYEDYARYMMAYKDILDQTLMDAALPQSDKLARLAETMKLAQTNMIDVRAKWPKLVQKALPIKAGAERASLPEAK